MVDEEVLVLNLKGRVAAYPLTGGARYTMVLDIEYSYIVFSEWEVDFFFLFTFMIRSFSYLRVAKLDCFRIINRTHFRRNH